MLHSPNNLIEKFAIMLEEGFHLNKNEIAQRTVDIVDIIEMISSDPSLNHTILAINEKLGTLLSDAKELKQSGKPAADAHKYVAEQLRELKVKTH